MSGHSKFANIKHKKEKNDAAKGKIFTRIGREIAVAVKEGGPDPNNNSKLKDIVAKAKANNMPNDTIDRSIKKAAGEGQNVNYEFVSYEGYGPSGIAIIVDALTDNKNRTVGDVRHLFDKYGGSLGSAGCVSYLFKRKGLVVIEKNNSVSSDDLFMIALEAGAEDILEEEECFEIYTIPENFEQVVQELEKANIEIASKSIDLIPDMYVDLNEQQTTTFEKMIDLLEDLDDVQNVYANFDIDDDLMEKLDV